MEQLFTSERGPATILRAYRWLAPRRSSPVAPRLRTWLWQRPFYRGPGLAVGGGGPDWNVTVIPVGRGAEGFDLSPDAGERAANAHASVSIIDVAAKKVVQTVPKAHCSANEWLKFT